MGDDLDDLDLRPAEPREAPPAADRLSASEPEPPTTAGGLFPFALAGAGIVLVAAVGALVFLLQPWRRAEAPASPAPTAAPILPAPPTAPPAVPELDASDAFVRAVAAGLSAHPDLARWLARSDLVRTLTAVVANIADGETPRPHLEFLAPRQRFKARSGPRRTIVADPAGFSGYDGFAAVVASLDASATAAAFRASEPLFDAAYRELGHPEGFRGALDRAIGALLAVPVPSADQGLVPHAIGFRWADPKLEGLTAAQKQFLRIGPRNVALVQGALRTLQAALAASPAAPPVESPSAHPDPDPAPAGGLGARAPV